MEGKVSRGRPGADLDGRRVVGRQCPLGRVDAVDEDLVQASVRDESEAVGGVEVDGVGQWPLLGVVPGVLDQRRRRAEAAVFLDRYATGVAAAVVGDQHVLALLVHGDKTRSWSARRLLVEQPQVAALRV